MEKSQWDLKKISFQRRQLTRLDDFVSTYKITLNALLREYRDSLKRKNPSNVHLLSKTTVILALIDSENTLWLIVDTWSGCRAVETEKAKEARSLCNTHNQVFCFHKT